MGDRVTYSRLGDCIREVNVRNRDLAVTELLGVSIQKSFIPSIANTIGTDMSTYKIVQRGQFAYGSVTSRNGDKVSIALLSETNKAIISQAYTVFEVIDKEKLLPAYLMMWFRRAEFDRYARFKSHGSAREIFGWDEMCDTLLPIPSIDKQREIVTDYEALSRRIAINEQLCDKLEQTAQALYRKMFVDDIDPENLPNGWRMGKLSEVASFCYGKLPNKAENGSIPVFSGYGITGYTNEKMFDKQHIIVVARGDAGSGKICMSPNSFFLSNLAIAVILKNQRIKSYLYHHLLSLDTTVLRSGSAQAQVTIANLEPFDILIPDEATYTEFDNIASLMGDIKDVYGSEVKKLIEIKEVLLSKLATN